MRTPVDKIGKEFWEEIISHDEDVRLLWTEAFENFLAIHKRHDGLKKVEIFYGKDDERTYLWCVEWR